MGKILLAVSDRWIADSRVDAIAELARKLDHSILAVNVAYGTENPTPEKTPGEQILQQVADLLRSKGAKVETLLLITDDVGVALSKTADEHHAACILLGLSSKGMLARLIEGNVAQEVIRSARVPVLLLPPEWRGEI